MIDVSYFAGNLDLARSIPAVLRRSAAFEQNEKAASLMSWL